MALTPCKNKIEEIEGKKRRTQKRENATLLLISLSAFDYKRYEYIG
jgi:hypothetical protein